MISTAAPSFAGVCRAAHAIAEVLPPTPAWSYPMLDALVDRTVIVKHENVQPTGAFKVRGGLALMAGLPSMPRGLVTASTGNHAQSIAFVARQHALPAIIVMPANAPACKVAAVEALGAQVVLHGPTMTQSFGHAGELAKERGWLLVSPGDEPDIVHGHATVYLELLRAHPDLQAIYVPAGSGSGAAGACLVRDEIAPDCQVIAVQSVQAPAAYQAWSAGRPATAACTTRAAGLATAASYETTQRILRARLDDFLLVDDDQIDDARRLLASRAHTLAEGAGAAALAGLLADRGARGAALGKVAIVVTGGNADDHEVATTGGGPKRT